MTQKHEYELNARNKNKIKAMQTGATMQAEYDQIVMEDVSGMKICLEFPKNTERDERVEQEVKAILSDELRDSLRRQVG